MPLIHTCVWFWPTHHSRFCAPDSCFCYFVATQCRTIVQYRTVVAACWWTCMARHPSGAVLCRLLMCHLTWHLTWSHISAATTPQWRCLVPLVDVSSHVKSHFCCYHTPVALSCAACCCVIAREVTFLLPPPPAAFAWRRVRPEEAQKPAAPPPVPRLGSSGACTCSHILSERVQSNRDEVRTDDKWAVVWAVLCAAALHCKTKEEKWWQQR